MNSRDTLTIHDNLHALTSYQVLILSLCAFEFVYSSPVADKIIKKKKHSLQEVWRTLPLLPTVLLRRQNWEPAPTKKKVVNLQSKTCLRGRLTERPQLHKN